ncbi:MAG: YlmC/YmxH family sporulation protein [Clostridia bacterium]|nr:YlmC/YmxH family sporulation protein [Clostridia bacterium]
MLKNFDLRQKRVIDVDTAEAVGFIRDMDIDFETGKIRSVTIPQKGIWGILSGSKNVTVPWERVVAIGNEFVIVKQKEDT